MSTDSHSDSLPAEQHGTASEDGTAAAQHGLPQPSGGRVLARIPDVRPTLEKAAPTQEVFGHRIDAAHSLPGKTVALLRQHHSSLHISRRLMAVVGSVVVVLAVAVFFHLRSAPNGSENRADLPDSIRSFDATAGQHANDPWSGLSNSTGEVAPWRGHDHGKHQDSASPAPDYFSERQLPAGITQPGAPGYRVGSTRRQPAGTAPGSEFKTDSRWPSEPIDGIAPAEAPYSDSTPSRVVAQLTSDDRVESHDRRLNVFPWRSSGQQLQWQRRARPPVQMPVERRRAVGDSTRSRPDGRFSGAEGPDRWNTPGNAPQQYPETGARGPYIQPSGAAAPRTGERTDFRSARGGSALGDEARRSTYDDRRRAGAVFDGHIESPNDRVRR